MTNVLIEYNPFKENTRICIDGTEISSTSGLYKYISTPLQDWITDLFQILTEHCNDDQLSITFKGLQYSCDLLEEEYEKFKKNNREYDIDLSFDVSKSELARSGMISNMIDELRNQNKDDEFNNSLLDILEENSKCQMNVYVIGGIDEHRHDLVDSIVGDKIERSNNSMGYVINNGESITSEYKDGGNFYIECSRNLPFVNSRYCNTKIYEMPDLDKCKNVYYRTAKESLISDEKPMVIYIVEGNNSDNNAEFLNLISDEYNKKGKLNKSRFIFVSDAPKDGQKILNSDFAIKKAAVLDFSCIYEIHNQIKTYQTQVCMISYIKNIYDNLSDSLDCFEKSLSLYAEKEAKEEKEILDIDELENKAISLLNEVNLTYSINYDEQEKSINDFKNEMIEMFEEDYLEKHARDDFTKYLALNYILSYKSSIKKQLEKEAAIPILNLSISLNATNEKIRYILGDIRCIDPFEKMFKEWDALKIIILENEYPENEKYLANIVKDIDDHKNKGEGSPYFRTVEMMAVLSQSYINYSKMQYILEHGEKAWEKRIELGKKKFGEYLDSFVTCHLKDYFDECNTILIKKLEVIKHTFQKEIDELKKTIKQNADTLRQEAKQNLIKKRLDYLKSEINKLIEL